MTHRHRIRVQKCADFPEYLWPFEALFEEWDGSCWMLVAAIGGDSVIEAVTNLRDDSFVARNVKDHVYVEPKGGKP